MAFCAMALLLSKCHRRVRLLSPHPRVCVCVFSSATCLLKLPCFFVFDINDIHTYLPTYLHVYLPTILLHCKVFGISFFLCSSCIFFPIQQLCLSTTHNWICSCVKKEEKYKKPVFSSNPFSSVYPDILYYSLRLKANLFSNCSGRQRKVQASFGQPISQKPVSTSFGR